MVPDGAALVMPCNGVTVPLEFTAALPPPALCTDNGAMIAWAGIERLQLGLVDDLTVPPRPRWPLDPTAERIGGGRA